jgi:tRNA(Ile)-lysidine synthase
MDSEELRAHLRRRLSDAGVSGTRVLAAVSGGPDSLALFELLADLRDAGDIDLVVGHVEHGIAAASRAGQACVAARAAARHVPLVQLELTLGADATETAARKARHGALRQMRRASAATCIVMAHHADDQAETVLLRVLGGSAPLGLRAMALRRGVVVRPLLDVPRAVLAAECARRELTAWEDPANTNLRHARAWLRQVVLPPLLLRDPAAVRRLGDLAAHAARDADAWRATLRALPELGYRIGSDGVSSIVASPLGRYDSTLASALLRALASETGAVVGPARAARVLRWLSSASRGGWVPVGEGWRAELVQGRVAFRRVGRARPVMAVISDADPGAVSGNPWRLRWSADVRPADSSVGRTGTEQWFAPGRYELRPMLPGDRIVPLGGHGHRRVVRCLQDAGVSGGRRSGWPVLVYDAEVVWVVGICRGAGQLPEPGLGSVRVVVEC